MRVVLGAAQGAGPGAEEEKKEGGTLGAGRGVEAGQIRGANPRKGKTLGADQGAEEMGRIKGEEIKGEEIEGGAEMREVGGREDEITITSAMIAVTTQCTRERNPGAKKR